MRGMIQIPEVPAGLVLVSPIALFDFSCRLLICGLALLRSAVFFIARVMFRNDCRLVKRHQPNGRAEE
jgi:hypothetical protein